MYNLNIKLVCELADKKYQINDKLIQIENMNFDEITTQVNSKI